MHTLPNSHHEALAQLLAQGYSPTYAYRESGFDKRNAAARAPRLAKNPNIRARVKAITAAIPRIQELQARFAPSALLMPETKEQVSALLWQISSGIRVVLPLQLRALTLLCRLNGWHNVPRQPQHKTIPGMPAPRQNHPPSPAPHLSLTPEEQTLLTALARQVIAADQAHQVLDPQVAQAFLAAMTDAAFSSAPSAGPGTEDVPPLTPSEDLPASSSEFPHSHPTASADAPPLTPWQIAHLEESRLLQEELRLFREAQAARFQSSPPATGNPPNLHISSPSQTIDFQPLAAKIPNCDENLASRPDRPSPLPTPGPSPALPARPSHHPSAQTPARSETPNTRTRSASSPHDHWSPTFRVQHTLRRP